MPCLYCFLSFPLLDAMEVLYRDDQKFLAQIAEMEDRAEANMERGGELVSASAELRTDNFKIWAGGADIATIAMVFTDIVGATNLNISLGDERWQIVMESHLGRAGRLIEKGKGYLLKTKGDGVIAAFRDAGSALDFALAFKRKPGESQLKIRAGIHIGQIALSAGDVFGQQVNMVARIEAKATDGGIWVSAKIKEDIESRQSARHQDLKWTPHRNEVLKGFPGTFMLWSVEEL
jgi:class 3 adenylate cyclase